MSNPGKGVANCLQCLALMVVLVGGAGAADFEPVTVQVEAREVTSRVWMIEGQAGIASSANEGFNSNAGFVVTDDGVVAFDALGTPSLGVEMLKRIGEVTDKPVRRLVISHYHSDHFYGAQPFADRGIPVFANQWVVNEYLKSDAPEKRLAERRQSLFPWVNDDARITQPDRGLGNEEVFRLGDLTFRIIHSGPAHTPEDTMMLVEELGVLFAGDLVYSGRLPWVGDADSRAWLKAIDKILLYKPRFLIPGHGAASDNAAADLKLTRDYLGYLRNTMGAAAESLMEFDEAYVEVDWSRYAGVPTFDVANRTNAYNTYLLMQRELLGK